MWREGWKAVAELSGSDKVTQSSISKLLGEMQIAHAIEGSKAYHVFIPADRADEAIRLLHSAAQQNAYPIYVLVTADSEQYIAYPRLNRV